MVEGSAPNRSPTSSPFSVILEILLHGDGVGVKWVTVSLQTCSQYSDWARRSIHHLTGRWLGHTSQLLYWELNKCILTAQLDRESAVSIGKVHFYQKLVKCFYLYNIKRWNIYIGMVISMWAKGGKYGCTSVYYNILTRIPP